MQPGGRAPAPGRLALLQAFINTHYDLVVEHGADLLPSPEPAAAWLGAHGLIDADVEVSEAGLKRVLALREGLRALAAGPSRAHAPAALESLNLAARGGSVSVQFGFDGPRFVRADAGVSGAIGVLAAITAQAMLEGSWSRLKVCPGEECGWAFYDHSRNQAGRWCSMSVCGGRAKARAHYQRQRDRREAR